MRKRFGGAHAAAALTALVVAGVLTGLGGAGGYVRGEAGCSLWVCISVTPTSGKAPLTVTITLERGPGQSGRRELVWYGEWKLDFDDGTTARKGGAFPEKVTVKHTYADAGTFRPELRVAVTWKTGRMNTAIGGQVKVTRAPVAPPPPTPAPPLQVGVNDDGGKYAESDSWFWQTLRQHGMQQNAMTVLWDETEPAAIHHEKFIRSAVSAANAAGIEIAFNVYPMRSRALNEPGSIQKFAAYLGKLAETFPSVVEYTVLNECNQPRFLNPQFDEAKQNRSATVCGEALAAGYDALKATNPAIFVWGIGLSPRGNDNPDAPSNVSTSPVKFLGHLGRWYRASGRTKPLMDGLDFHPYPIPQSLPFEQGYGDKENASVSNLDRIYQAFYDAFKGTAQPTIGQQAGGGLPVSLNEVGIQTLTGTRSGYAGAEFSTPDTGVLGDTATEAYQADWYVKMLNLVACDANVEAVNLFHLIDESDLGGWQSGLFFVDRAPKAAAAAVRDWIAQTGGNCRGRLKSWTPGGSTTPAAKLELFATPVSGSAPLTVKFRTGDRKGVKSTRIDFGDGTSTSPLAKLDVDLPRSVSHVYGAPGTYEAKLQAVLEGKNSWTDLHTVTITVKPMSVPAGISLVTQKVPRLTLQADPEGGMAPLTARFRLAVSPAWPIQGWILRWNDGTQSDQAGGAPPAADVVHTFRKPGRYTVTGLVYLKAPGGNRVELEAHAYVNVSPPKKDVSFTLDARPSVGSEPLSVVFEMTLDSDEPATRWELDFGDRTKKASGTGDPPSELKPHVYAKRGPLPDRAYKAVATVWVPDASGKVKPISQTVRVSVHGQPLYVSDFAFDYARAAGRAPRFFVFAGRFAINRLGIDGKSVPARWVLRYGDGSAAAGSMGQAGSFVFLHAYVERPGRYVPSLTVYLKEASGEPEFETMSMIGAFIEIKSK